MIPALSAFVAGLVSATGFQPIAAWPAMLACLAVLAILLRQAPSPWAAVRIGWCFGFGQFVLGLNWIATAFTYQAAMPPALGWVAVVLLSLYLAVWPALAALAARWAAGDDRVRLALLLGAGWTAAEWLRATVFTGFAWNPVSAVWAGGPLAMPARLIGTYGLSGLTVAAAAMLPALWQLLREAAGDRRAATGRMLATLLPFACLFAFTIALRGVPLAPAAGPAPLVRIVQPNVNQNEKWDEGFAARNFARLVRLSGRPGPAPRLLLWPEVAVPDFLEEDALARLRLAALLGPRDELLTGAQSLHYAPDGALLSAGNSLFALDPSGAIRAKYDKAHLVPYGEYLPMRPLLSRLGLSRLAPGDIDFRPGPGPRTMILPRFGAVGAQICYEIVFSGHVIDPTHRPRMLFNPSNDAWFGRWGPPQHLAQAQLRAVEEGLPVLRSTPTGISAVIDADGRLLASLPWHAMGAIERPLPPARVATPFARIGNLAAWLFALALAAAGVATRRRAR
ncbi:MAG: apolipoprotein N-acyltransferase [Sphingomonas fennica]